MGVRKCRRSTCSGECDPVYPTSYGTNFPLLDRLSCGLTYSCRTILYPKLEDNEVVHRYPDVQGMEKNVFFFSHNNPENSEDDSVSKHNMFEVRRCIHLHQYASSLKAYHFH